MSKATRGSVGAERAEREPIPWRDQFLSGAQAALHSRPSDERDEKIKDLQAKIGELTMDEELLQKIERLEAGRPRPLKFTRPASIRRTSRELCLRATSIARHWRVTRRLPSGASGASHPGSDQIRSQYAHTWLPYAGLSLIQDLSLSHSRPRFGCLAGTFSPSWRQIRSTRLWFTRQPSAGP